MLIACCKNLQHEGGTTEMCFNEIVFFKNLQKPKVSI